MTRTFEKTKLNKYFLLLLFVLINSFAYAQNYEELLLGKWICIQSLDSTKQPINNNPVNFYSFEITKNKIYISSAPFNTDVYPSTISVDNKIIQLYYPRSVAINRNTGKVDMTQSGDVMPYIKFEINDISEDKLILSVESFPKGKSTYIFARDKNCVNLVSIDTNNVIENKYILLKDLYPLTKRAEYWLEGDFQELSCQPTFKGDFGTNLIENIKIPRNFPKDSLSSVIIVQFIVNKYGTPENVEIIQGLNEKLDDSIINAILKTKKKWEPVIIDGNYQKIKTRYYFLIYKNVGSFH